jgi:hypothetical protein
MAITFQDLPSHFSVQEHGTFLRRWHAALVVFSEQSIAKSRHDSVTEISQRPRNQPQEAAEYSPSTAQNHQDASDCGRADVEDSISEQNQRVELFADSGRNMFRSDRSLERGETQTALRISGEKPVDGVVTESANTVEEDNGMRDIGVRRIRLIRRHTGLRQRHG